MNTSSTPSLLWGLNHRDPDLMVDAFSCKRTERFSRGATVDADERFQGQAEVHYHPFVGGIAFGMSEMRVSLA